MSHERRRGISRYVVPHPAYSWFLRSMAVGTGLCGAVLAFVLNTYESRVLARLENTGILQPESKVAVEAYASETFTMTLVLGLTLVVFVVLMASFFFHRVAGPMYRMTCYLREVQHQGRKYRLKFRDGDQFQELADLVNRSLDGVDRKPKQRKTMAPKEKAEATKAASAVPGNLAEARPQA